MCSRAAVLHGALGIASAALILATAPFARAQDQIKIGVIAEAQAVAGSSIPQAAQLAADEINAKGGVDGRKIEIVSYDNHSSSAESVRAFQRAVNEDHVNAVIGSYISEVALALEPWASRLKTVFITPGAASDVITQNIAKDYEHNKYTFHGYLTSSAIAGEVCDAAKDLLVDGLKMKTAVIMSEDAAWTTPFDAGLGACLPKIGFTVLDHIRFSPDTTDFTPIFNQIEGEKPDVIITGISHVGVQPTVQWKSQQVPIPMLGVASQATNSTFWKDTNGATQGVLYNEFGSGRRGHAQDAAVRRCVRQEIRQYAFLRWLHGLRRCLHYRRCDQARGKSRQRQARRRDGGDRLRRHDRPGSVPAARRSACARPEDWRWFHYRSDAAMAEWRAGQHVAGGSGERQAGIPTLRQDRLGRQLTGGGPAASNITLEAVVAVLAASDRRLRDLVALRSGRDRLHPDFRRHRDAQPLARGGLLDIGGGRVGR